MDKEEIIRRLKNISRHAVHVVGEPPFIMSLDDGIALDDAVRLLKEQEIMSPDKFKGQILCMFSSIWDCEIDHPVFQDKVGELMDAVVDLYRKAVKRDD